MPIDSKDILDHEVKDAAMEMFNVMVDCGVDPNGSATHPSRTKALDACRHALNRIEDDMAKPMTERARNFVDLFCSRSNISEDDVNTALEAFGGQHAAARKIIEHASALKVPCKPYTRDEQLHYAVSLIMTSCSRMSFPNEKGIEVEYRYGLSFLKVCVTDWQNWLDGYESMLGSKVGPLMVMVDDKDTAGASLNTVDKMKPVDVESVKKRKAWTRYAGKLQF